jgi:hypothetical protein
VPNVDFYRVIFATNRAVDALDTVREDNTDPIANSSVAIAVESAERFTRFLHENFAWARSVPNK